jgi:hypothetical protein
MIASSRFPLHSQNWSDCERRQVKISCHSRMQTARACRWKEEYRTLARVKVRRIFRPMPHLSGRSHPAKCELHALWHRISLRIPVSRRLLVLSFTTTSLYISTFYYSWQPARSVLQRTALPRDRKARKKLASRSVATPTTPTRRLQRRPLRQWQRRPRTSTGRETTGPYSIAYSPASRARRTGSYSEARTPRRKAARRSQHRQGDGCVLYESFYVPSCLIPLREA